MSFIPLLQNGAQGQGNMLMSVVPFILIIAIFYFFIILHNLFLHLLFLPVILGY